MSKISSQSDFELSHVQKFLEIVKLGKKLPDLLLDSPTAENINMLDKSIINDDLSHHQIAHIKKISRKFLIELYTRNENFNLNEIESEEEKKRFTAIRTVLPRIEDEDLKKNLQDILLNPDLDYQQSLTMASVEAYRGGFKSESGILDTLKGVYSTDNDKSLDETLDKEIKSHSPEYIALKFKGEDVDFNKLITKCSAKSADIILKAAEKHSGMKNSKPSKWKELLIEFSDFCKNRGRKSKVDNMREKLKESNSLKPKHTTVLPKTNSKTPDRDMDL